MPFMMPCPDVAYHIRKNKPDITTMTYINFNDDKLPIGKRKQAYVKWAVSKGTDLIDAQRQANKKFGFEQKPGILAVVTDYGHLGQASFNEYNSIWGNVNLKKYIDHKWILTNEMMPEEVENVVDKAKSNGWEIIYLATQP
jgi:hypothetical protein